MRAQDVLAASGHGYLQYAPLVDRTVPRDRRLSASSRRSRSTPFRRAGAESAARRSKLVAAIRTARVRPPGGAGALRSTTGHVHWQLLLSGALPATGLLAQIPFALLAAALAYALGRRRRSGSGPHSPHERLAHLGNALLAS